MKSYAFKENKMETYEYIVLMKKRIEGKIGNPIQRAPKKECLKMFGGQMSIEEFRGNETPVHLNIPHENYQIPIMINVGASSLSSAPSKGTELQLKRSKPLERSKGKLEKLLGKCSDAVNREKERTPLRMEAE
jgi:hypothetical protein